MNNFITITNKNEALYLEYFNIISKKLMDDNKKANSQGFYFSRLKMLMSFYNKGNIEISTIMLTNVTNLRAICKGLQTPTKVQIRQLSLLFEVPDEFFTKSEIKIKINEQLKIELCQ